MFWGLRALFAVAIANFHFVCSLVHAMLIGQNCTQITSTPDGDFCAVVAVVVMCLREHIVVVMSCGGEGGGGMCN